MNDAAASAAVAAPRGLYRLALSGLSVDQRRRYVRVRWHDRLVSLWAPVTVLAVVFLVYLVVAETWVCATRWLVPLMQVFGVVVFLWWVGLVGARVVLRGWNQRRARRYHADEVVAEVARVADRNRGKLKGKVWAELVSATTAQLEAYLTGAEEVAAATRKLDETSTAHLARFRRAGVLDLGGGFVKALAIALLFRAVAIEPYKIPSGSMIPTLQIGDQVFVNKFIYGVRLPFTNYVPFVLVRPPARGDVIVFNNPAQPQDDYIKRVMGVPGDVLEFTEEGVVLNGTLLRRTLVDAEHRYWDVGRSLPTDTVGDTLRRWVTDDWTQLPEQLFVEYVDGRPHYVLDAPPLRSQTLRRTEDRSVTVPEGHVFVMGDNRNNSEDSRFGLGDRSGRARFVPFGSIKGKAMVIWLSLSRGGLLSGVFGGTGLRYDRFFRSVSLCEAAISSGP